jgi:pimeloyl-ACP methyl ester carboxylesterase
LPAGAEEVSFLNRDQQRLAGCFIRAASQPALGTLIFFHGQAGNITNVGWLGEKLASRGFDVLLFDYRGYGKSEGEITDERDLYADADAAYQYVVNERGSASNRIVLYGHSLGTAAAIDVASRRSCAAVVLESGFSSASDMASIRVPWMPNWLHQFAVNRFESAKKLASVSCAVVVAHGDPDDIVPTQQGRALYSAVRGPRRLIILPGAGHGVAGHGGEKYLSEVMTFIQTSIAGSASNR